MNTDIMGSLTGAVGFEELDHSIITPVQSVLQDPMDELGGYANIKTDTEMSQFMDELINGLIEGYDPSHEVLDVPIAPDLKWRYSSAYQKAVRRNDPSINAVATALNACDPQYIWRRGPTIAMEDISMGDPWVCAMVMHACRFARVRNMYGKDELAGFLGTVMGMAVKDRLSCDSFCLPFFHPELKDVRDATDNMSNADRADLYRSDEEPFAWRMAAGISLAGPRYGGDIFTGMGGHPEAFAEAVNGLVPYPIQWLSRQYSKMARDGMFVAMPMVWRQLIAENKLEVVDGTIPDPHYIQGVLSATFDGHTQEGRRAIAYYRKSCSPVTKFFGEKEKANKLLGLAIFTADSSLLDRYIISPWAQSLYEENLRGEVMGAGVEWERFAELVGIIVDNREGLVYARSKVTS